LITSLLTTVIVRSTGEEDSNTHVHVQNLIFAVAVYIDAVIHAMDIEIAAHIDALKITRGVGITGNHPA
jgi:hypothetical protein